MTKAQQVQDLIGKHISTVIDIVKDIGTHPELGYKEFRTSGIVNDYLCQSGYKTETNLAITGIKTQLKMQNVRPNIAVIGELDGITCPESTHADKLTGATHHCGHHLQLGVMMLLAKAFMDSDISSELGGNISFIATPAEEYIELDYRAKLRKTNEIRYFGGKQELIHRGVFDNIDAAVMVHSQSNQSKPFVELIKSGNGFIAEKINYTGKTAHAAASPEEGINALHAAILGVNNVNALRETLRDKDHSCVHYIITKGGDAVNSIPADVRLECFVRSGSVETISDLLAKTNRAFIAGGEALGAKTEIELLSGYLPLVCNEQMNTLYAEKATQFMSSEQIRQGTYFKASTDMGDLTHLMPAIHVLTGGVKGSLHTADFEVVDYHAAIEIPARIMASTLIDLLSDNATKMRSIIRENPPLLTKHAYTNLLDSYFT
ncbi:amidohydrolase [uncultured Parabacteroides sp.]|uniref:amidohydrolase n=1 Tax=uncultured Parabacteroides sp. TaxID=512312 RepID=UPI00259B15CD|nr:amidohydrolase [uncultured Parabacteroides sp.]